MADGAGTADGAVGAEAAGITHPHQASTENRCAGTSGTHPCFNGT